MVKDFTFNDVTASSKNIIVTSIQRPILPTLRQRKMTIPGKDGAWDFGGNTYDEQMIKISCMITRSLSSQSFIRELALWLSKKGKLSFNDEPDKYYIGRVYEELINEWDGNFRVITITFECEPFAYAEQEAYNEIFTYDNDFKYDEGIIYPNESEFTWNYFRQGVGIYNHSSLKSGIEIKITGSVESIKITHQESGEYIELDVNLIDESITIDTEKYIIEKENGDNLLQLLSNDSNFFKLDPGANALLFEGNNTNCSVQYIWKHKFL